MARRPGALTARGTVLDVHPLERGTHYGYRRRRAPRDCHLVVVSGGTAHGVALEAPRTVRGPVGRGKALAVGTLAAANLSLSPFRWAGKQRWFAEPPHMHVSLLLLPASVEPPAIGTELDCDVRLTTLHPDAVAPLPAPATARPAVDHVTHARPSTTYGRRVGTLRGADASQGAVGLATWTRLRGCVRPGRPRVAPPGPCACRTRCADDRRPVSAPRSPTEPPRCRSARIRSSRRFSRQHDAHRLGPGRCSTPMPYLPFAVELAEHARPSRSPRSRSSPSSSSSRTCRSSGGSPSSISTARDQDSPGFAARPSARSSSAAHASGRPARCGTERTPRASSSRSYSHPQRGVERGHCALEAARVSRRDVDRRARQRW